MRTLKDFHTRQLMTMLVDARIFGRTGDPRDPKRPQDHVGHHAGACLTYECHLTGCWSYAEIKAELGTREHLPNKRERKKIRQAKAKQRHRR